MLTSTPGWQIHPDSLQLEKLLTTEGGLGEVWVGKLTEPNGVRALPTCTPSVRSVALGRFRTAGEAQENRRQRAKERH